MTRALTTLRQCSADDIGATAVVVAFTAALIWMDVWLPVIGRWL